VSADKIVLFSTIKSTNFLDIGHSHHFMVIVYSNGCFG